MKKSLLYFAILFSLNFANAQGAWQKKADAPNLYNIAANLSIGNNGYVLTFYNEFWEWNQSTNSWIRKADFPGNKRSDAAAFSIGTKGYIGTGTDGHANLFSDFWEWDQATDTWTQKADIGGLPRACATGFAIGTKGYIATGLDFNTDSPQLWEWNQITNIWSQKAVFGGGIRTYAVSFVIGNKAYLGTGEDSIERKDFWEWDQVTDTWTQKANFGGVARHGAKGFSIGTRGYIGTGYGGGLQKDFWTWDQSTNTWQQLADFPGGERSGAIGFSIGNKGYLGLGDSVHYNRNDFWEFNPDVSPNGMNEIKNNIELTVFPNPAQNKFTIELNSTGNYKIEVRNISGVIIYSQNCKTEKKEIDLPNQPKGIYFLEAVIGEERRTRKIVLE